MQSAVTDLSAVANINKDLAAKIEEFKLEYKIPHGVSIVQSGESEQQAETNSFLGMAFILALGLIFLILVMQFNSLSKPFIVLTEIFFLDHWCIPWFCHNWYDYAYDHGFGWCDWISRYSY